MLQRRMNGKGFVSTWPCCSVECYCTIRLVGLSNITKKRIALLSGREWNLVSSEYKPECWVCTGCCGKHFVLPFCSSEQESLCWEIASGSTGIQLSNLLWKGEVHSRAHSSWPLDTILIQLKAGYTIFPFLKPYSNIISPPHKFFLPLNSFRIQYCIQNESLPFVLHVRLRYHPCVAQNVFVESNMIAS